MERTNDPVLSVRNLSVSFADAAGTLHAVDDVSFDVPEGGILGVVGESGSGKTVSLMSTMGMIESSTMRVSGSALFRGRDLLKMDFAERAALRGRVLVAAMGCALQQRAAAVFAEFAFAVEERMLAALNGDVSASTVQTLKNVRAAVDGFVKEAEQFDDLTMLCFEYKGPTERENNNG